MTECNLEQLLSVWGSSNIKFIFFKCIKPYVPSSTALIRTSNSVKVKPIPTKKFPGTSSGTSSIVVEYPRIRDIRLCSLKFFLLHSSPQSSATSNTTLGSLKQKAASIILSFTLPLSLLPWRNPAMTTSRSPWLRYTKRGGAQRGLDATVWVRPHTRTHWTVEEEKQ